MMPPNELIFDSRMLRIGDVFRFDGKLCVVTNVNESAATCRPVARKAVEFTAPDQDPESEGFRKKVKFERPESSFRISSHSEVRILVRLGKDWNKKNLAGDIPEIASGLLNLGVAEKQTETMKIKKEVAVSFLSGFGFEKAGEWDDKKLVSKLKQVPEKVTADDLPDEFKALYQELCDADGKVELEGATKDASEVPAKKEEKSTKSKPEGKAESKPKPEAKSKDKAPAKTKSEKAKSSKAETPAKKEAQPKAKPANGEVSLAGRSDFVKALVKAGKLKPEEIFLKTKEKYPTSSRFNVDKIIAAAKKKLAKE